MLTPLDIHNKEFKHSLRGYDEAEVDQFLDDVVQDYETIYRELKSLKERIQSYEEQITNYQSLEESLKKTLMMAQEAAERLRSSALQESEVIVQEAELKATKIVDDALNRAQSIVGERDEIRKELMVFKSRFKAMLLAQIELIDKTE